MNIDISPYIKEILLESSQLVIPGLGALTLEYAPSTIEHVKGLLKPPSKKIRFDQNLLVNDGKLVDFIQKRHRISSGAAEEVLQEFVSTTKKQLEQKEMVHINGVGRLYSDFENRLQFIPDTTNFNKDSYGLPEIKFFPVLRNQPVIPSSASSASATSEKNSYQPENRTEQPDKKTIWQQFRQLIVEHSWIPAALVAALIILAIAPFLPRIISAFDSSTTPSEIKVNQPPVQSESSSSQTPPSASDESVSDKAEQVPEEETSPASESDAIEPEETVEERSDIAISGRKLAQVSVGVFANRDNAQRRIEEAYDAGFNVIPERYSRNGRELTKVIIEFSYESDADFEDTLISIREYFDSAVVIKKEE